MAVSFRFMDADYEPGPQAGILRSRLKERCRTLDALKSTARLRPLILWSTAESRRGMLIAGRGGGPIALLWRS